MFADFIVDVKMVEACICMKQFSCLLAYLILDVEMVFAEMLTLLLSLHATTACNNPS
jgi:hypothetical protein